MLSYPIQSIQWDEHLYATTGVQFLQRILTLTSDRESVLMVGHNPSISDALSMLTASDFGLDPGCLAAIHFDLDWNKIQKGEGQIEFVLDPTTIP